MDEYAIEATEFQEQLCVQKRPLTIIKRNNGLDLNYFMDPGLTTSNFFRTWDVDMLLWKT